jgi:hypothetical protein
MVKETARRSPRTYLFRIDMEKQELQGNIDTINRLILEVRAFKVAHPEHKTGFQPGSPGSLLNAYREGDIGFDECVELLGNVAGHAIKQSEAEPEWEYTMVQAGHGEYRATRFDNRLAEGWEPHLFSDGQLIMRRRKRKPL